VPLETSPSSIALRVISTMKAAVADFFAEEGNGAAYLMLMAKI